MRPALIAFAAACVFLGAALYITIVEQPARMSLAPGAMVKEWQPSNRRGFVMLSVIALAAAVLAYADFAASRDARLLAGGTVMLASWLYAFFVVVPVDVMIVSLPAGRARAAVRSLMRDWGLLEWGQTAIAAAACVLLGWVVAQPA
jgi:ACR3 family arsenite efflux pump ArsB